MELKSNPKYIKYTYIYTICCDCMTLKVFPEMMIGHHIDIEPDDNHHKCFFV